MTKIKICGLMTLNDIDAINYAKPDLAGFIFAKGRHQISFEQAMKLRQKLDRTIPSVGVFVNESITEMIKAFNSGIISLIQLHGNESEETVKALQEKQIPVINVFKPTNLNIQTVADYVMLDSGAGNGNLVNWEKLNLEIKKPLIIAGALNIDNIQSAIKITRPAIVDLSRGVETNRHKDPKKILDVVKLVHQL